MPGWRSEEKTEKFTQKTQSEDQTSKHTQPMSCSDILLTFLMDTGDNWTDSFQFPEDSLLPDISDLLSCEQQDSCELDTVFENFIQDGEFTPYQEDFGTFSDFCSALAECDEEISLDMSTCKFLQDESTPFAVQATAPRHSEKKRSSTHHKASKSKAHATLISTVADIGSLSDSDASSQSGHTKKRKCSKRSIHDEESLPCKQQKTTAIGEKLNSLVQLLKNMKKKREEDSVKRESQADPLGLAQNFLNIVMGSQSIHVNDMLAIASPTVVYECSGLSSIFNHVQTMKADTRLPAWAKPAMQPKFPDKHIGVGQSMAAARCFTSILPDVMSHTLAKKLQFFPRLSLKDAIVSPRSDQLTSPFTWQTQGLISLGYPSEVEISGLIRCSFCKEGISIANVSYDAFTLIRKLDEARSKISI